MEIKISDFLDGIQTSPNKLKVEELREREKIWRVLWSWLDDDIKSFLIRAGTEIRIMRRDYKGSIGELGQVHFEIESIEIHAYEKSYNYEDGKYYYEDKIVKIPGSVIAWYEFISSKELVEEAPAPSVAPIPEEEVPVG